LLRSRKNRFGPSDDIAVYRMTEMGLDEISHPSLAFLQQREDVLSGMTIVPTIEGAKAMLIEVQALVTSSSYSTPSRKASGLDQNRLALLLAVLEKRVGYQLHNYDVFVSIAGGMKIKETGIDLGVLLAVASSIANEAIDEKMVCFGEVGLGGEIRNVFHAENRIREAIHMGFTKCILPKNSIKTISKNIMRFDIGVTPNISNFRKGMLDNNIKLGMYKSDFQIRFKNKSNIGRNLVLIQHGIPVVTDFMYL